MISVLILTKNEEHDLPGCLDSVKWCDDIHVFDSFSNDKTVEIAQNAGAKVTQRVFDNYSTQRNKALESLPYKHQWLLILDADERVPDSLLPILRKEIENASPNTNGFRIRRKDFLNGQWLKHAQISPFYIRLIKIGKAKYSREINEVLEVDGEVKDIDGHFDHYPFSKGYTHWLNKHNTYSSMEAQRWIDEHKENIRFSIHKALLSKDFTEKRYHQKGIFYKLPARPFIKWVYMVFGRRAFLDGRAGLMYATLQSIYEYFIIIKTKELLSKNNIR